MQRFDSTVYTTHHLRAEKASVERVLLALRSANRGRGDGGGGAGGDGHVSDTTHSPAWHDKLWCLLRRQYPGSEPLLYTAAWEAAQECKCAHAEIESRLEADARAMVAFGTGIDGQPRCSPGPLKKPRKHRTERHQLEGSGEAQCHDRVDHRTQEI